MILLRSQRTAAKDGAIVNLGFTICQKPKKSPKQKFTGRTLTYTRKETTKINANIWHMVKLYLLNFDYFEILKRSRFLKFAKS